ncbi:histidine acid phosphatase [Dictyocaulus viviparus]|uniref:Histidine acid phosphatase n=1 Tax=Dictyocaulus viviparus TaxID=29172 RepID=A0A0D8XNL2_DICVI|nr:histidine acid phosphatase [Dictyocaulus viviparus]
MLLSGCLLLIITSSFILGRRSSEEQNGKAKLVPIEANVDSLIYVHASGSIFIADNRAQAAVVALGLLSHTNSMRPYLNVMSLVCAQDKVMNQQVWRHGDRTPAYSVPFNDVSTWEEGLGELTKKGIAQQYRLGKWLRARYYNWLGQRFHRSEVWRHGDRTPAYSVPFNDVSTWEEGLGELTKKGIAQQYRLGKWLRARYYNWLGQRFHRSEVFVRSSDYNRTLMSAQANMAGLFPPSKSEIWDDKLDWQPVPIHSVPKVIDKELYEDIDCPTASSEFLRVKKSEVVRQMERENEDLIKYLGENSKIPNFDIDKLRVVYDNIFCMVC